MKSLGKLIFRTSQFVLDPFALLKFSRALTYQFFQFPLALPHVLDVPGGTVTETGRVGLDVRNCSPALTGCPSSSSSSMATGGGCVFSLRPWESTMIAPRSVANHTLPLRSFAADGCSVENESDAIPSPRLKV